MITNDMIKETFIHRTMMINLPTIYYEQSKAVEALRLQGSGRLLDFLDREPLEALEAGKRYALPTLQYLRFLDILYSPRSKGNRQKRTKKKGELYNKVTWGIVFREIRPYLRYGLTKEIKEQLHEELSSSLNQDK